MTLFVCKNRYAVFSALRELFGTAEHWRWGALGAENAFETVARLSAPPNGCDSGAGSIHDAVVLRYYVQFHLDSQLRAASAFAKKKGVLLKGDLPIGVDKASVDTWMHPTLFRMHASTGAPPDQFDPNGQNWGFPTYNWDAMSKDGYEWWRERMRHLERYFSAMRVDHVLGFFRIWELPGHARLGKMGRFRPSVPIRRHELDKNGLWFVDRLCDPWITGVALRSVFGDRDGEGTRCISQIQAHCLLPLVDYLLFTTTYITSSLFAHTRLTFCFIFVSERSFPGRNRDRGSVEKRPRDLHDDVSFQNRVPH